MIGGTRLSSPNRLAATLGPQGTRPMIAVLSCTISARRSPGSVFSGGARLIYHSRPLGAHERQPGPEDFKRQVALYARHPELGADMLARTGSDPLWLPGLASTIHPEGLDCARRGRSRLAGSRSRIGFYAQSAPGPSICLRRYLPHLSRREAEVPCDLGRLHACL